jgi:GDP/UDP-N,N'-diacetylbacillosamine 2-epimerase (hydrolysing)
MKKICVITGTRAEYGLLKWVMRGIQGDPDLKLQIIVTGMHLSPEFGLTYKEIERDGFVINQKVEMLLSSDTPVGIAKSIGIGTAGIADSLNVLQPDIIVVLGDRFEILSAVSAALVLRIPVAHLHGGEATEGLIDEAIRHSITKMSHLHFVASEEYRKRVIQLGEQPDRVFLVGGLGVDTINKTTLLNKAELEKSLKFKLGRRSLLITFHPVTLDDGASEDQFMELLSALSSLEKTQLIFTLPNADTDGRVIGRLLKGFLSRHSNARAYTSLGQVRYLSCISHVNGVIGNSSSGLTEVPTFKKGTINIGDRQRGRLQASSVINCSPKRNEIQDAIRHLFSDHFQSKLNSVVNPYGNGGAVEGIVKTLKSTPLAGILKKQFYDREPPCA